MKTIMILIALMIAVPCWAEGDCIFPDNDVEQFWNHGGDWFREPKRTRMQKCAESNELISFSDYKGSQKGEDWCLVAEYRIQHNPISKQYKLQYRVMPKWEAKMCCGYRGKPEFKDYPCELGTLKQIKRYLEIFEIDNLFELEKCQEIAKKNDAWEVIEP